MVDPVEVELKLEYEPADKDRLIAAMSSDPGASISRHLVADYFDTPDLALDKAGYTLRIRHDGQQRVQTVKAVSRAAAGLFVRGEWERPVSGTMPEIDDRSGPIAKLFGVDELARLTTIFVADVERVAGPIDHDTTRIEYAIDSGEVRAGQRSAPLAELELELKDGSPQHLFDLARAIDQKVPLRLGVRTKSARGYALIGGAPEASVKAEPIRLERTGGTAAAFVEIAGACIRHYRFNETLVIQTGAAEAIHQARVALRRLRSAFSLFGPLFKGDERAITFAGELRWLAAELGAIRDIDVLLPRLEPTERTTLATIRGDTLEQLRIILRSGRARLLPIDLTEWLAIGAWQRDPRQAALHGRDIRDFATDRLDRLRRRIKQDGRKIRHLDDEHRHEVRKDAKKLRYAAEFFGSLYPGRKARRRLDRFLDGIGELQDSLGQLNDFAAAPDLLARHGLEARALATGDRARPELIGEAADCFKALIGAKRFWRG